MRGTNNDKQETRKRASKLVGEIQGRSKDERETCKTCKQFIQEGHKRKEPEYPAKWLLDQPTQSEKPEGKASACSCVRVQASGKVKATLVPLSQIPLMP